MTLTMSRDRNETFIQSGQLGIRQYIDKDNCRLVDVIHNDNLRVDPRVSMNMP